MADLADYYHILDLHDKRVGKPISATELKHAYKRALLLHHPDKHAGHATSQPVSVDDITQAYKTLADPHLRARYDSELRMQASDTTDASQTRHTGMETIDLEDLDFNEESAVWSKPCRCGSQPAFVIVESELEKNAEFGELITGCKGCSLWLTVLFSVAD